MTSNLQEEVFLATRLILDSAACTTAMQKICFPIEIYIRFLGGKNKNAFTCEFFFFFFKALLFIESAFSPLWWSANWKRSGWSGFSVMHTVHPETGIILHGSLLKSLLSVPLKPFGEKKTMEEPQSCTQYLCQEVTPGFLPSFRIVFRRRHPCIRQSAERSSLYSSESRVNVELKK